MAAKRRIRVVWLMLGVVAIMAITYLIAQQLARPSSLTDKDIGFFGTDFESIHAKESNILKPNADSYRCRQGISLRDKSVILVRFEFNGAAVFKCDAVLDDRYSSPLSKVCDAFPGEGNGVKTGSFEGKAAAKFVNSGISYYFLLDSGNIPDALAVFGIVDA